MVEMTDAERAEQTVREAAFLAESVDTFNTLEANKHDWQGDTYSAAWEKWDGDSRDLADILMREYLRLKAKYEPEGE